MWRRLKTVPERNLERSVYLDVPTYLPTHPPTHYIETCGIKLTPADPSLNSISAYQSGLMEIWKDRLSGNLVP